MYKLLSFLFVINYATAFSQPATYTVANAHSHNDYEQPVPFYAAYYAGFGSTEADIFWYNGEILVAHTTKELPQHHTLEDLYLKPIQALIEKNKGFVFADSSRRLQLMIDIKTEAVT